MTADFWESLKPSTFTRCWYNDLYLGSKDSKKDTHPDQRVTTKITMNCRQPGIADFIKVEIDTTINFIYINLMSAMNSV